MPKGLKRYYGQGHLHFVTFSRDRRLPLSRTARARNHFLSALEAVRARSGFRVAGDAVMPEHVHLLISRPTTGSSSTVLKVLKQRISRYLRRSGHHTPDGQFSSSFFAGEKLARFWQPRFHDFNVWSAKKRAEKLEYMHVKPSSHSGRIVGNSYFGIASGLPVIRYERGIATSCQRPRACRWRVG